MGHPHMSFWGYSSALDSLHELHCPSMGLPSPPALGLGLPALLFSSKNLPLMTFSQGLISFNSLNTISVKSWGEEETDAKVAQPSLARNALVSLTS